MPMKLPDSPEYSQALDELYERIRRRDFTFLPAEGMRRSLDLQRPAATADWAGFVASWNDLALDTYMADGGRYRRRRYATLSAAPAGGAIRLEPHQPHYQDLEYNRLNGGVARHFEPIDHDVITGPTLSSVLALGLGVFARMLPAAAAHIEVHQFRIEALPEAAGRPTPEGVHRDGVDFVLVMMVRRENIASGTTEIFDLDARPLDSFTLTAPLDTALVNDRRAMHGVTPIEPIDPGRPAFRDVLVATYRGVAG